jgi:hypothetical protein
MLVRQGGRTLLEARAKAEPTANVVTSDYYTQLPQIRLSGTSTARPVQPETVTDVTLDGNDVANLVECAIRHPAPNMRNAVLAAIWNDADAFRQIFQFGLDAPAAFPEIRRIVAEELGKRPPTSGSNRVEPAGETLLPRMPLPAHLRDRER